MTTTICAMGELLAEFLSRNPHQKFTQPGEFIGPFPSGAPAIFAAQVAKLSHRAIFFGCVGNDDFARLIIERLRHEGVITDGIHVMNNAVTGTAFVSYQNPQQRDFVFNILTAPAVCLLPSTLIRICLNSVTICILWAHRCSHFA